MWKLVSYVKIAVGLIGDLLVLPVAIILLIVAKCYKSNFNPTIEEMKANKKPLVLCIHGNNYNEMQWIFFRYFLGHKYHIVTWNLDGLVICDPNKGIQEYADLSSLNSIELCKTVGYQEFVYVGHSMGGLVAARSALDIAAGASGIKVSKVITISTPWHGSTLLKTLTKWTRASIFHDPLRFKQMREEEGTLAAMRSQIAKSTLAFYVIHSEGDAFVNVREGLLGYGAFYKHKFLGHLTPMISPSLIQEVERIIDS